MLAEPLADWALSRCVVRADVYGAYRPGGGQVTARGPLDRETLIRHFQGAITIGAHSLAPDGRVLMLHADIDAHDATADPQLNWDTAERVAEFLGQYGLEPLIFDSNGKGGYWVRAFLKKPISGSDAFCVGVQLKLILAAEGFAPIEWFPKQAELSIDRPYGNWARLPGKHHKRDHWTRIYDPATKRVFTGEDAARRLIKVAGDDTKLLLDQIAVWNVKVATNGRAQGEEKKSGLKVRTASSEKATELDLRGALEALPDSWSDDYGGECGNSAWLGVGMALHDWDQGRGLELWKEFSQRSAKYEADVCNSKWTTFTAGGGLTVATIFKAALENGWKPNRGGRTTWSEGSRAQGQVNDRPTIDAELACKHLTDYGNAERLVARFGHDLRYVVRWKKPLAWDGTRWVDDESGLIARYAKQTARSMLCEAATVEDSKVREAIISWSRRSESKDRQAAMLALAYSEPGIAIRHEDLDRDPWLLNVANGTLDLRDGSLNPHRRVDLITKLCSVVFDREAECPRWDETLELVFENDPVMIAFFQRLCGCCLTGDVSEHILPIFHGEGQNGKTTLMETMMNVLGPDYAMSATQDFLMVQKYRGHTTEYMSLFGKRLVVASETGEDCRLDEPLVKRLTGSDEIRGRRMREDEWSFKPTHKLFLSTNHEPKIRGTDHAIWRRVLKIPCTFRIPPERAVKGMADRLREEAPGILAWAVRGCVAWHHAGDLGVPSKVSLATKQYREDQDELGPWIAEGCDLGIGFQQQSSDLYANYKGWAERSGIHPMSSTQFGRRLPREGITKTLGGPRGKVIFYSGIKLR